MDKEQLDILSDFEKSSNGYESEEEELYKIIEPHIMKEILDKTSQGYKFIKLDEFDKPIFSELPIAREIDEDW